MEVSGERSFLSASSMEDLTEVQEGVEMTEGMREGEKEENKWVLSETGVEKMPMEGSGGESDEIPLGQGGGDELIGIKEVKKIRGGKLGEKKWGGEEIGKGMGKAKRTTSLAKATGMKAGGMSRGGREGETKGTGGGR